MTRSFSYPKPKVRDMGGYMSFTKQPKRRQIKKLMSKSICTFNGRKGIVSPMYFESPLARDYCYFLEFDTSVLKYESEPLGFIYFNPITQKECQYTPDFKVWFTDGSCCYYEIKYQRDVNRNSDFENVFLLEKKEAQAQGSDLLLITDEFISKRYFFENLVLLYRYISIELNPTYVNSVIKYLQENQKVRLGDLIDTTLESCLSIQQLYALIWSQQITAALHDELLSLNTFVSLDEVSKS